MKKFIIFLIMIMIVPIIIFSSETSYSKCLNKAENYMDSVTYRNTYKLYLYDGKSSFITHKEYLATLSKNNNSYLFDGEEYWTKTKKDSKYYTVSSISDSLASEDNSNIKTKVTEYILPTSTVTGSGTVSNPWIFKDGYKLNITSNNYGNISLSNDSNKKTNKISLNLTSDTTKHIYLFPNDKYEYVSNNCNFELKTDENNNDYLYVKGITSSMNCEVVFGKKSYKITLKDYDGDGKQQSVEPNIIYSIKNVGYFSNNSATTILTKLTKIPKKKGYNFKGYKNIDGKVFINEKGEVLQNINDLFESDSEAYIYDEPITYNIDYKLNDGKESGTYPKSAKYDTEVKINNPTRSGFSFVSWTIKNEEGTSYSSSNSFKNLSSTQGYTVTFSANWKDTTPPTCKLKVVNGKVEFASKEDNVGVTSSGIGTSENYTNSSFALTAGTIYGYVKDAAGNKGTCSINIKNATITSYIASKKTCNVSRYTCSKVASKSWNYQIRECKKVVTSYTKKVSTCKAQKYTVTYVGCTRKTYYTKTYKRCATKTSSCTLSTCNKSGCSCTKVPRGTYQTSTCSLYNYCKSCACGYNWKTKSCKYCRTSACGCYSYKNATCTTSTCSRNGCSCTTKVSGTYVSGYYSASGGSSSNNQSCSAQSVSCNSSNVGTTYVSSCTPTYKYESTWITHYDNPSCPGTYSNPPTCNASNIGKTYAVSCYASQVSYVQTSSTTVSSCTPTSGSCTNNGNVGSTRVTCTPAGYGYKWGEFSSAGSGVVAATTDVSSKCPNMSGSCHNDSTVGSQSSKCVTSITCDSGTRNGNYCYLYNQTSCPSGWSYSGSNSSSFTSSSATVSSCSVDSSTPCSSPSDNGKTYTTSCTPASYSCPSGYTLYNKYCYKDDSTNYNIKFNSNGGTGTMADKTCTYGTNCTLTSNSFTRSGYTFSGWATSPSGSVVYSNGDTVLNLAKSGTYNLYAVWTEESKTKLYTTTGSLYSWLAVCSKKCDSDSSCSVSHCCSAGTISPGAKVYVYKVESGNKALGYVHRNDFDTKGSGYKAFYNSSHVCVTSYGFLYGTYGYGGPEDDKFGSDYLYVRFPYYSSEYGSKKYYLKDSDGNYFGK